eukprot:3453211-Rhodomonas_salina.1
MQWEHQPDYGLATTTPELFYYLSLTSSWCLLVNQNKGCHLSVLLLDCLSGSGYGLRKQPPSACVHRSAPQQITRLMAPPVSVPCPAVLDMGLELVVGMVIVDPTNQ